MKKFYTRQPVGLKPIKEFTPHSLSNMQETQKNIGIQKLLININLFYLKYNHTPPLDYLSFVHPEFTIADIEQAIKYLAQHEWFSIITGRKILTYHITDKFKESFYHHCKTRRRR